MVRATICSAGPARDKARAIQGFHGNQQKNGPKRETNNHSAKACQNAPISRPRITGESERDKNAIFEFLIVASG